jgi:hypothetical protein
MSTSIHGKSISSFISYALTSSLVQKHMLLHHVVENYYWAFNIIGHNNNLHSVITLL